VLPRGPWSTAPASKGKTPDPRTGGHGLWDDDGERAVFVFGDISGVQVSEVVSLAPHDFGVVPCGLGPLFGEFSGFEPIPAYLAPDGIDGVFGVWFVIAHGVYLRSLDCQRAWGLPAPIKWTFHLIEALSHTIA